MATRIISLSEEDAQALARLLADEKNNRRNAPSPKLLGFHSPSTDCYIAEIPTCGIPAADLTSDPPVPGSALCDIYNIVEPSTGTYELQPTGYQERVFNLDDSIFGGVLFTQIVKEKYGRWIPGGKGEDGFECGTSSGTGANSGVPPVGNSCAFDGTIYRVTYAARIGNYAYFFRESSTYRDGNLCSIGIAPALSVYLCCTTGTSTGEDTTCVCEEICVDNLVNENFPNGRWLPNLSVVVTGMPSWTHEDGGYALDVAFFNGALRWVVHGTITNTVHWYSETTIADPNNLTICPWNVADLDWLDAETDEPPPIGRIEVSCEACVDEPGTATGTSSAVGASGCYEPTLCVPGNQPWSGTYTYVPGYSDPYWSNSETGYYILLLSATGGTQQRWGIWSLATSTVVQSGDAWLMPYNVLSYCPSDVGTWLHTTEGEALEVEETTQVGDGACYEFGTGTNQAFCTSSNTYPDCLYLRFDDTEDGDQCTASAVNGFYWCLNLNPVYTTATFLRYEGNVNCMVVVLVVQVDTTNNRIAMEIQTPAGNARLLLPGTSSLCVLIEDLPFIFGPTWENYGSTYLRLGGSTATISASSCCEPNGFAYVVVPHGSYSTYLGRTWDWGGVYDIDTSIGGGGGGSYESTPRLIETDGGDIWVKVLYTNDGTSPYTPPLQFRYSTDNVTYGSMALYRAADLGAQWDFSGTINLVVDESTVTAQAPFDTINDFDVIGLS